MVMSHSTRKVAVKNVLIRPEDTASNVRNILAENEADIHKMIRSFKGSYNMVSWPRNDFLRNSANTMFY